MKSVVIYGVLAVVLVHVFGMWIDKLYANHRKGVRTRLLKKLRRRARRYIKLRYYQNYESFYEIVWKQRGYEMLKYNIDNNIFLYKKYSQISGRLKMCELESLLWKARECVVRYMFEELKEKKVNREISKI